MTDRRFKINTPSVVSEIIDGEAVIMNLKTGSYFSSDKLGAVLWEWVEQGRTFEEMLSLLQGMYDVDAQEIETHVNAFMDDLVKEELVQVNVLNSSIKSSLGGTEKEKKSSQSSKVFYEAPVLHAYTDMKDLLILDPIHDVDEVGWPTPKPNEIDSEK